MEPIKHLNGLLEVVKSKPNKKISVVNGHDLHTLEAAVEGINQNIVDVINFGNRKEIEKTAKEHNIDISKMEIVDVPDIKEAIKQAVIYVREGKASILMKGFCGSSNYMRGILNKEWGLLPPRQILSHVTVVEVPSYKKLLIVSDVAVLIAPDLKEKVQMLRYCINVAHSLGIEEPKAAILSSVEKVNMKQQSTIDGAIISKMAQRGDIKGAIVDGPLALDVAVSKECVDIKKLKSGVDGYADILIMPSIEAGNIFYKACTQLGGGELAAIVVGATAPCVLTSRADSDRSKLCSIALASLVAKD